MQLTNETDQQKKTYYVAVGTGEILEPHNMGGNFEFEIRATDEQIDQLAALFEESQEAQDDTAVRAHIPYREYHNDKENDAADYYLRQIYRKLHELGTAETRAHIERMNVLPS
ncbi:hypothetical protein [Paenibacillus xerothermodurans]|uniref:Hydrolase n=1 Tax=Paenibacillus xerothermodurans TaxID=1977292 RepID=A0A2W1NCW3_PAEXE|nr:hypothetical protein [Paenibacillus xerothermodurans]PZE20921.1 hypothetical protein CBW46_009525 [Paenibacillus xerothermodurans]